MHKISVHGDKAINFKPIILFYFSNRYLSNKDLNISICNFLQPDNSIVINTNTKPRINDDILT